MFARSIIGLQTTGLAKAQAAFAAILGRVFSDYSGIVEERVTASAEALVS